jgi:hypothetical protein
MAGEDSGLAVGRFAAYAIQCSVLAMCVKTKRSSRVKKTTDLDNPQIGWVVNNR